MKKFIIIIFLLGSLILVSIYHQHIINYIMVNYIYKKNVVTYESNVYKKKSTFNFVKETNQFVVDSKQDILNTIYTVLNNGWENFTFYCDSGYKNCIDDTRTVISDNVLLSNINNFVHPYNSYDSLTFNYNSLGKIEINVSKVYTANEIGTINYQIINIINNLIDNNMDDRTKIRAIHDYIINNSKYDNERADHIEQNLPLDSLQFNSHKASGPLIQNMAICSGYSDAMAIFLNYFGIDNYKISNSDHVWNLVKLDNEWYHLDLTWNDPIVDTGEDILLHTYFLITTEELEKQDISQHSFSKNVYSEVK